jgi:hypothetical protein
MPGNAAEPVGANELLSALFRVLMLTVLPMQGRMAGVPVGDLRLPSQMQEHQEPGGLVVAVYESCCQSRTNHRYERLAPADGVGVGVLWLVLVWMDRPVARTQRASSSEIRRMRSHLAPVKGNGMGLKRLKRNPQPPGHCVPVATP